jgi:hypothetical protein
VDIKDFGAIGQVVSGIGALILAGTALWARKNYARQVTLEQMKWLQQLYDSFYNSERYKAVRQLIDFDDLGTTLALLKRADTESGQLSLPERTQVDQFTDYLNFFEWIAFLEKEGQLTFEQVDAMFKYYVTRFLQVDKNRELRKYIQQNGYEQLHRLLNRYAEIVGSGGLAAAAHA